MAILVTGGAGYIGSHTVSELTAHGEDVIVLDNLQKGHRQAINNVVFYHGDIRDPQVTDRIFSENRIDAVVHFAADSLVGESVADPLKYYDNNVITAQRLLTQMNKHHVKKIVFSSTAAVYGEPVNIPIKETDRTLPTNPYGETKLAIEKMLHYCDRAYGIKYIALRYFNAAGAHPYGTIGEDHHPESHLIPIILQAALGQRGEIAIYGNDYPTPDGTCIRDYIHVMDLAQAHRLALQRLKNTEESDVYNLGNGKGFSVFEVVKKARAITGHAIPASIVARRPGDPAVLVASSEKARTLLGWTPHYHELDEIIASAWKWHKANPGGFGN
ncbi:UDP-glucose 4-epimerase GalE [Dehalobacter sp. DCM]|uniref:UDP-glucose 4-epimerase GalE n=1 Tax=Dehalobacter sp. DCM TaxID=2907827 RepID=UPI0030817A7C|nr:UDP-glucose 4-epimerase GalE [Dehalobacter sp. DCM]